jgi:hypothetical protein
MGDISKLIPISTYVTNRVGVEVESLVTATRDPRSSLAPKQTVDRIYRRDYLLVAVTDSVGALNVGSLLMSTATAEDCLKPLSRGPGSGIASTKFCYDPVAWIICDPSCLVSPLRINTNPGSPWPWSLVEASYRNCHTGSLSAGRARTP